MEWRAASPAGEQLGPTVPTVFAQWVREGRIGPDWSVWRSDWNAWRTAADAVEELPAPLPASADAAPPAKGPPSATNPKRAAPPDATLAYARRRRRARQRSLAIVAALAIVATLMVGLLVWRLLAA